MNPFRPVVRSLFLPSRACPNQSRSPYGNATRCGAERGRAPCPSQQRGSGGGPEGASPKGFSSVPRWV
eukprot:1195909-Prorocentrum_minimum.AAC.3